MAATEVTPLTGPRQERLSAALKVRILTSIVSLVEGYDIGVVNGAVVLFRDELGLSSWQVGVVLSIFPLGVASAAPFAGAMADCWGRKPTIALANLLLVIGGLIMASATSFFWLALGRVTAGTGAGIGITAVTAYMSEVAPAHKRGFYSSLEELFVNVGNIVGYLLNVALFGVPYDWRIMLGAAVPFAFVVGVTLLLPYSLTGIPESPRYLEKVGRLDEARQVLTDLLKGDVEEVERATTAWQQEADDGMATWGETLEAFSGEHRRAGLAGVGVGVMNMFTGMMLMMVATTLLLANSGMEKKEAMRVTVLLGFTKAMVMLVVALYVLDRWGRRPLLQTSLAICTTGGLVGAAGAYFDLGHAVEVAGLCLFVTGYSVGVGPVPWVYMPEALPNRYRGKGCAMGLSGARLCAVSQLLIFPVLLPHTGMEGLFVFLVVANLLGLAFVTAFCPETMGLSLEEVNAIFQSRGKSACD